MKKYVTKESFLCVEYGLKYTEYGNERLVFFNNDGKNIYNQENRAVMTIC